MKQLIYVGIKTGKTLKFRFCEPVIKKSEIIVDDKKHTVPSTYKFGSISQNQN